MLQIPTAGKWILQTDASESNQGAIFVEENDGERRIFGYKNRTIK